MEGFLTVTLAPYLKLAICGLIFMALVVVYCWDPEQRKKKKKQKMKPVNCVEIDPRLIAANSNLLSPKLDNKQHSTHHVTLELLDEYMQEVKKNHIRSFDEI
jgi:hypothetical protein